MLTHDLFAVANLLVNIDMSSNLVTYLRAAAGVLSRCRSMCALLVLTELYLLVDKCSAVLTNQLFSMAVYEKVRYRLSRGCTSI